MDLADCAVTTGVRQRVAGAGHLDLKMIYASAYFLSQGWSAFKALILGSYPLPSSRRRRRRRRKMSPFGQLGLWAPSSGVRDISFGLGSSFSRCGPAANTNPKDYAEHYAAREAA